MSRMQEKNLIAKNKGEHIKMHITAEEMIQTGRKLDLKEMEKAMRQQEMSKRRRRKFWRG